MLRAISLGMEQIGFSDHSYTFFDDSWCMKKENIEAYRAEIMRLRGKYKDKIEILCGIEQDFYSEEDTLSYDYVIGSVHYVKVGDRYVPVDESKESFQNSLQAYFAGDALAFAECYFDTVADVVKKTNAHIIGHFDLITKFNREGFFDESDERYVAAWKRAVDRLLPYGRPFEINTGAISRGYMDFPYPAREILAYIKEKGGSFLLSSDAHSTDAIAYAFDKWQDLI